MTTAARSHRLRCLRTSVSLPAEVESATAAVWVELVNLSGSGCLFETDEPFTLGERVHLQFSVPGLKDMLVEAEVVRSDAQQVAVAFLGLDERATEVIAHLVVTYATRRKSS